MEYPMPPTYVRTFRVRYYECDTFGRVNHTNYLRYMQEAAFDASAAVGYDLARYEAINRFWLVRETEVEIVRSLRYGDSVQVKTWVADFRRVRSRRMYELRLTGSEELVAQAYTDWAFLDSTTGRPVPIPPKMVAAFFPEGPPEMMRPRFPSPPPPPPGVFRLRRWVEWGDIDSARHVNNAVYLAYMEECAMRAATAHNWPLPRMQAEGFAILARGHHIEYRQPALLGDELELVTWLSDVERTSAVRHYSVIRVSDGALLARARSLLVWTDVEMEQPVSIPPAFLRDLAPNVTDAKPEEV
jgi:acyl-CoA thioester hydrolase